MTYEIPTFKLFPNPVKDQLNVTLQNMKDAIISITDKSGKILFFSTVNENNVCIDVSDYCSGHYLVTIKDQTNIITRGIFIH